MAMRKAVLTILVAAGALWGLVDTAEAFCHKVRTTCIGYYPGLYSFAPCGYGYPPYVYSCVYRYPKFCGHRKAGWRGYLSCASQYPYNCGYGACGGCGYGGCGSCGYGGCGACGSYGCGGCGTGCGGCESCGVGCDGCGDGGCACTSSAGGTTSFETDSKTIDDGPAPGPEPAAEPEAAEGDPMASTHQIGFRRTAGTRRDGTSAYARGLRSYWDGQMSEALRAFDAAAAAEPENALYQYYRALSFYNLQGPDAAGDWLAQAVEMERQSPIKNWGRQMERVQGRARLWVEQARNNVSLGR
jgi:hypothetical protein